MISRRFVSAGFNVVTGPAEGGFLRSAGFNNLRVIASMGSTPGRSFSNAQTEKLVRLLDSHPQTTEQDLTEMIQWHKKIGEVWLCSGLLSM